jgi:hypothetical protein
MVCMRRHGKKPPAGWANNRAPSPSNLVLARRAAYIGRLYHSWAVRKFSPAESIWARESSTIVNPRANLRDNGVIAW